MVFKGLNKVYFLAMYFPHLTIPYVSPVFASPSFFLDSQGSLRDTNVPALPSWLGWGLQPLPLKKRSKPPPVLEVEFRVRVIGAGKCWLRAVCPPPCRFHYTQEEGIEKNK